MLQAATASLIWAQREEPLIPLIIIIIIIIIIITTIIHNSISF